MQPSTRTLPRWLLAFTAGMLLIGVIAVSLPNRANAQDDPSATPAATETPTETPTVTAADTTSEADTSTFADGDTVVVADGPLNVRDEAGTAATVKFQLETGDTATVSDGPEAADDYNWYEITTADDETGWVAGEFLAEPAAPAFTEGETVAVIGGTLNVRSEGNLDADLVTQLETGDTATILGGPESADGYTWFQVQIDDDTTGWVAGEFLENATAPEPEYANGDTIKVIDGPLNVREQAGTNEKLVIQLDLGDTADVLSGPVAADGYDWYKIQVDSDTTGWVAADFIAAAGDSGADTQFAVGDGVRVAVDGANFRSEPGLDGEVLDTLDLDALMLIQDGPVEADGYTWYQVFNYFYGEGWVAGAMVTLDPSGFPADGQ